MTDHRTLEAKILAMYLGQKVRTTAGNDYELIGIVNGDQITTCYLRNTTGLIGKCHIEDCKPILRKLESIPEGEVIELIGIYIPEHKSIIGLNSVNPNQLNYKIGETVLQKPWDKISALEFQWLLSRGFDLFGLIDSGLAIAQKGDNNE